MLESKISAVSADGGYLLEPYYKLMTAGGIFDLFLDFFQVEGAR